ncbi:MAG TPA: hypothetical protein VF619_13600 [Allosphingosinicella sp.]|jgi:erythromycin esterase-like protein
MAVPKLLLAALLPLAALAVRGADPARTRAAPEAPGLSLEAVKEAARPIAGAASDYSQMLAATAGARRILLGESTHGTHEY